MNTSNLTLTSIIGNLETAPRVAALRGVAHSTMAKAIGAIRQDIRDRKIAERQDELDSRQVDLDQRNSHDEDARAGDEIAQYFGFDPKVTPLQQASIYHAAYDWALVEIKTIQTTKWDTPLTVTEMLEFMTRQAQPLDPLLVKELAKAAKCREEDIAKLAEVQNLREREQLIEAAPEIVLTFNGFGDNGYDDAIEALPGLAQYQLGLKLIESMHKAKDAVLSRVLRSRRISDLGSLPLFDEAISAFTKWTQTFEERNSDEIRDAIEAGRNLRTLDDVEGLRA